MSVGMAVFAAALRGNYPTEVADILEVREAWKEAEHVYFGILVSPNDPKAAQLSDAYWVYSNLKTNYRRRLSTLIDRAIIEQDLDAVKVRSYRQSHLGELL